MFANEAFDKLTKEYVFKSVLDIGCGSGKHSLLFHEKGKDVTAIDLRPPKAAPFITVEGNYIYYTCAKGEFDCIWASHVLEHQLNPHTFLTKIFHDLKPGGVLAITVPPLKHEIVGGHVSLWNMGLLFYRLVLAGFDCTEAIGKAYDYNISVIVRKKPSDVKLHDLGFDSGDIEKLQKFFPRGHSWPEGFNGDIKNINW